MKHPSFMEKYISGFPFCRYKTPIMIEVTPEQLNIRLLMGFSWKNFSIPASDIVEIGLNQETYRSAGKAAAGAIVGGVLTGGIGLLAGAALGGKRRKDNEMTLVVDYQGTECNIELKSSKTIPNLYQEIKKIFKEPKTETAQLSQADELQKFAELKEKGIITPEEFETKKKQILGL